MNSRLKKFAPFGLYFSLLAVLVSISLYIVFKTFDLPIKISLACIPLGLAVTALLDPQAVRSALTGRQARYGSNAAVLTIAVIGIVVVANVLVVNTGKQWDLTEDKSHTLAKESINALKSLKAPVKAEAYFSARNDTTTARDLLDSYKANSDGKFSYEFIDPDQNPAKAKAANVISYGTIVLTESGHSESVITASEQEMTNALIRVDNPGSRKVYFLTGHGEFNPDDSADRSYSTVKQLLVNKNYGVATLNLLANPQIPDDAKAIIIAGATTALADQEVNLIKAYQQKGGGLIVLSEPVFLTQAESKPDPINAYLESAFSVKLGNDLIIDPNINPNSVAVDASYGNHVITQKLTTQHTVFPTARSVSTAGAQNPDVTSTPLISTAKNTWGETDKQQLVDGTYKFDEANDTPGPVNVATAAVNNQTSARLVVVGDADFASNTYSGQYGNSLFFMNVVDWAAKQDDLINLTPKNSTQRILALNSPTQMGIIMLVTFLVVPGAGLVAGILSWIGRRRRG